MRSEFTPDDYDLFIEAFCTARDALGIASEEELVAFVGSHLGSSLATRINAETAVRNLLAAIEADTSAGEIAGLIVVEFACLAAGI